MANLADVRTLLALAAHKDKEDQRIEQLARNYAAADKSDPFAYARAKSHIVSGVASYHYDNGERTDAFWGADKDGRNLTRP